jgi:hypothetical protein
MYTDGRRLSGMSLRDDSYEMEAVPKRACRGTKTVPYPDNCGLPLYNPWPNSDRFFFNGAYWYPKIEMMNNMSTGGKVGMTFGIIGLVLLIVGIAIAIGMSGIFVF